MKILLSDDHGVVRDGLRAMLAGEADCHEAENFSQTLEQLRAHPDIELLLLDLNMPDMECLTGLKRIREEFPAVPVVVVSMHTDIATITTALSLGVAGYIPKTHHFNSMKNAINLVLNGDTYIPPEILNGPMFASSPLFESLTKRQREIYELLIAGKSNQEMADKLCLSLSTIKMHVSAVLEKAQVSSRTKLLLNENNQFNPP